MKTNDLEYNKYIAEGRLIRICPKKLEAKDLIGNKYFETFEVA